MHYRVLVITKNNSLFDVVKRIKQFECDDENAFDKPHILCIDNYQIGGRFLINKVTVKVTDIDELGTPHAVVTPYSVIGVEYFDGDNFVKNNNFNTEFEFIKNKYSNYYVTVVDVHM